LRRWKDEILAKIQGEGGAAEAATAVEATSASRAAELRAQVELAIAEERYEDAALLRDELRRLETRDRPDDETN
jgi:protein-arginine kinase activator protein McsA